MDGNGRWAEERGRSRIEGHREGAASVRDVVRASRQLGLRALTLYAFSAQNWARPAEEVAALMELLREYLVEERPEIMGNEIRLRAIGDIDRLPPMVRQPLDALIADSAGHERMTLTLALSYGGREAIAKAVANAVAAAVSGTLAVADVTVEMVQSLLPTRSLPELDLVIRTSGEQRVSNFMLWELAYAELYFTDVLWPDFRRQQLYSALEVYAGRERRFGLTSEQVEADSDLWLESTARRVEGR